MEILDKHLAIISGILTIITSIMTIFSGIKNNVFMVVLGILLTLLLVAIFIKIKQRPKYTEIEGIRIEEADNIPIFATRKNILNPLSVVHIFTTEKTNATLEYEYCGVCTDKNGVEGFATILHSNDINNLADMNWFAYDLKHDPNKTRKILP